jgi:hypothetical protein
LPDWAREFDEWPQGPYLWPRVVTLARWGFCAGPDILPEEVDGHRENGKVLATRHDAVCPGFRMAGEGDEDWTMGAD